MGPLEDEWEEPPEGIYHYTHSSQVPPDLKKYWARRRDIFSEYDSDPGIWMTDDAWYGVTPEAVATKIAEHVAIAAPADKSCLIDCFAGVGGNAIAFALSGRWKQIFAIEKDPKVLACAKHNAEIYGVQKKIWFINADCFEVVKSRFAGRKDTVIFASPPWGGPGYTSDAVFDLSRMEPYSLDHLYKSFSKITKEVALYLPRTSNLNQVANYAPKDKQIQVLHYCMNGFSKAMCVYFGDFNFYPYETDHGANEDEVDTES